MKNTTEILANTTLIDEWGNCQLRKSNEGFYMISTTTGNHFIPSSTYNERVQLHWGGFLKNNGRKEFATN